MTSVNPVNDRIGLYSQELDTIAEANIFSIVEKVLADGSGIELKRDPATGIITIVAVSQQSPVCVDGITIFGDGTAANPLRAAMPAAITITPATIPNAVKNSAYTQQITASGGVAPYTWSVVGSLPAGLSLNPSTGVLSGTPTVQGSFPFEVNVVDDNGLVGSRGYFLSVAGPVALAFTLGIGYWGYPTPPWGNEHFFGFYNNGGNHNANELLVRLNDNVLGGQPSGPSGSIQFGSINTGAFPDGVKLLAFHDVLHDFYGSRGIRIILESADGGPLPRNYFSTATYVNRLGANVSLNTNAGNCSFAARANVGFWWWPKLNMNDMFPMSGTNAVTFL